MSKLKDFYCINADIILGILGVILIILDIVFICFDSFTGMAIVTASMLIIGVLTEAVLDTNAYTTSIISFWVTFVIGLIMTVIFALAYYTSSRYHQCELDATHYIEYGSLSDDYAKQIDSVGFNYVEYINEDDEHEIIMNNDIKVTKLDCNCE